MVDAMLEGKQPDTSKGAAGALRSLHNNYLTLPVLFIMVSNHFPSQVLGFQTDKGWVLLSGVIVLGWVFTWFAAAWIILGVLNIYAGRFVKNRRHSGERMSFANMTRYSRLQQLREEDSPRWSGDSGQGTERNSDSLFGTGSPGIQSTHAQCILREYPQ